MNIKTEEDFHQDGGLQVLFTVKDKVLTTCKQ